MALPPADRYRHRCIRRRPEVPGPDSLGDVSEVGWVRSRCCSRTACKHPPVYTLTYVYRDSTAVLGPLAAYVEPHCYDLCEKHAARLTAPRGWDVVRLPADPDRDRADDLEALANAVMETRPRARADKLADTEPVGQGVEVGRRGHLRVLRSGPPQDG